MRLLILGGSDFLGPALIRAAADRGWRTTVFNRSGRPVSRSVSVLTGDRTVEGGLSALVHGRWDVVVDTWYGAPSAVRETARLLAGRVGRYVYISSRAVHAWPTAPNADEEAPVLEASPDDTPSSYAQAKRAGEVAVLDAFGEEASLTPRPGIVLGPRENVGRLLWWLRRMERGGVVAAPGPRDAALQYVDVRDLAAWVLHAVERELHGPYNVVSPPGHATTSRFLDACRSVTNSDALLRWVDPADVLAAGLRPDADFPLWVPPGPMHEAMHQGDGAKAANTGLECRPLADTVADTWAWMNSPEGKATPFPTYRPLGIDPAEEEALVDRRRGRP